MTTTTATVHNPTNFEPSDYAVVDYLDNKRPQYCGGDVDAYREDIKMWEADMRAVLGADWIKKIHRCVHCGNGNVRWITAVKHAPSGETVVFGSDCTERLGFANKVAFKLALLQSRADTQAKNFKLYQAKVAFLAANPAIADALVRINEPVHARNSFAKDVLGKLAVYGSLSARQIECVLSSMQRDIERAASQAVEAVEPKGDAPSGRADVSGVVLTIKTQESDYGSVTKMLLKLDNNSKVWLTVPAGADLNRGDRCTVRATFTVSNDDKSFAFGKRPIVLSTTPATVAA